MFCAKLWALWPEQKRWAKFFACNNELYSQLVLDMYLFVILYMIFVQSSTHISRDIYIYIYMIKGHVILTKKYQIMCANASLQMLKRNSSHNKLSFSVLCCAVRNLIPHLSTPCASNRFQSPLYGLYSTRTPLTRCLKRLQGVHRGLPLNASRLIKVVSSTKLFPPSYSLLIFPYLSQHIAGMWCHLSNRG